LINWMATFAALWLWRVRYIHGCADRRVAARHIMKLYSNNNAVRVIKVLVRLGCKNRASALPQLQTHVPRRHYGFVVGYGRAREAVTINNAPARLLLYNKFYVVWPTSAYCEIPFWAARICVGNYIASALIFALAHAKKLVGSSLAKQLSARAR
jgi:hypothetical protein